MPGQHRIVVTGITRNFFPDPLRLFKYRVFCRQFNFGDDESFVVPVKFVHFPDKVADGNPIACFINHGGFGELKHGNGILKRN